MRPIYGMLKLTALITSLFISCAVCASDTNRADAQAEQSHRKQEQVKQAQWKNAPDLPYAVQEIYPAYYKGHIVVAGGLSPDVGDNGIGVSDRVVIFDVKAKTWRDGPALPEPRHHPMLVVVDGRLLSFGGFVADDTGMWHNSTDVLELKSAQGKSNTDALRHGKWHKIAQMPAPLAETLSAVHNGRVHLVSGRTPQSDDHNSRWNEQTDVNTHYIFDAKTQSFSDGPGLPTARNSACSVQHNGNWHTIAGRTVAGGNLANHEAYDFQTDSWVKLAPLPDAQGGLACAVIDDNIYVFGGEYFNNGGGVYADVWQYSIASNTWRSVAKMPKPRHGLGTLAINDSIYVIAGALQAGGNQTSPVMSVFKP